MLFPGGITGGIIVLSSGTLYRKASEPLGQLWVTGNVNNGSLGAGDRSCPFTQRADLRPGHLLQLQGV